MSRYAALLAKVFDENIPFSVLLELTYRCNLDCFFCYNDIEQRGRLLTLEQYFRFFADLRALGTMNLSFSGGEPLAHPHFFDLGRKARELGFVVRIKSNGHALRPAMIERIRDEIDPFVIEISLHGVCAATHDRQTRVPGSFRRLMANLETLKRHGLRTKLNSTLTAWNEAELKEMFALADGLEIPLQVDPTVTPRDDGDSGPTRIAPSSTAIERLYRLLRTRRNEAAGAEDNTRDAEPEPAAPKKHCGAGASGVTVDPFGNVYPCVQWRVAAGNLHEQSIAEIWQGSSVLEEVRAKTTVVKTAVDRYGQAGRQAGFCPGLAVQTEGEAVTLDSGTLRRINLIERAS